MKTKILTFLLFAFTTSMLVSNPFSSQGQNDPWTPQQLLAPADLAKVLNNPKSPQPIIYSIGMQAIIKNSIDIGPTMRTENLNVLKQKLSKLSKNSQIVIYCGCCPFSRCPNIRPPMELLKSMQFTNYKLLNLPENIKVDWIDLGYPMSE
jgi:thiosulfate/3-mercaptopyruvate sulfurtransferase